MFRFAEEVCAFHSDFVITASDRLLNLTRLARIQTLYSSSQKAVCLAQESWTTRPVSRSVKRVQLAWMKERLFIRLAQEQMLGSGLWLDDSLDMFNSDFLCLRYSAFSRFLCSLPFTLSLLSRACVRKCRKMAKGQTTPVAPPPPKAFFALLFGQIVSLLGACARAFSFCFLDLLSHIRTLLLLFLLLFRH